MCFRNFHYLTRVHPCLTCVQEILDNLTALSVSLSLSALPLHDYALARGIAFRGTEKAPLKLGFAFTNVGEGETGRGGKAACIGKNKIPERILLARTEERARAFIIRKIYYRSRRFNPLLRCISRGADSRARTQPEDRGASEAARRERDAEDALQPKADDGEGADENGRGDGRSGEIDKRPFPAAPTRRTFSGQAESVRGHAEGVSGERVHY